MKKTLSVILLLVFTLCFTGCGESDEDTKPEVNPAETYVETQAKEITVGDYSVQYRGAINYNPYKDDSKKSSIVVYFDFANNSDKAIVPNSAVQITAKQGETVLDNITFTKEYAAPEQYNFSKECKSGEHITFCCSWEYDDKGENVVYEIVNSQDSSKKSSGTIEISTIDLVKQTLSTEIE